MVRAESVVLAAALSGIAAIGSASAAPLSVEAAFRDPVILTMTLSPNGRTLLAVGSGPKANAALLIDAETLAARVIGTVPLYRRVSARWIDDDKIALSSYPWTNVVDLSGKLVRRLNGRFIGRVRNGPDGHERVLVADGAAIHRIDLETGDSTWVNFEWPGDAIRWAFDDDGVPLAATTLTTRFLSSDATVTQWYRKSIKDPWQMLEASQLFQDAWSPLYLSADGRSIVVLSAKDRDTRAVWRYSIEEHRLVEMMAGHPTQDITWFDTGTLAGEPAADGDGAYRRVTTLGMKTETYWFDGRWATLQNVVDAAIPGRINWLSGNIDSGRVLVHATADVDPGTWYLLDVKAGSVSIKEVGREHPHIDPAAMRPMQVVRYPSPDGLVIPAYLTLPAGPAKSLPAVVLIHGGPIVRDRWEWDPEVQLLASRGYAVLQPQFRGSAGFGYNFQTAGYGQWGRGMQDDVTAGAKWLVSEGIADPKRMCIVGGSYGGYAAMWAIAKTPDLFRCGVSLAGVSDLGYMLEDDSDVNETKVGRLFRRLTVGDARTDPHRFDDVSPLLHAGEFGAPVLIAHGDRDARVPISHSEKLVAALQAKGKTVEWLPLRGEGHGFSKRSTQQLYYKTLFEFLAKHTDTPLPPAETASQAAASAPN